MNNLWELLFFNLSLDSSTLFGHGDLGLHLLVKLLLFHRQLLGHFDLLLNLCMLLELVQYFWVDGHQFVHFYLLIVQNEGSVAIQLHTVVHVNHGPAHF